MTLIVKPINVATVTAALVEQIKGATTNVEVERAEEVNETPGRCPWVGVYRDNVTYVAKTVGFGTGYRDQRIALVLAVQAADASSGENCETRLEELLALVLSALLSDTTLGGTVNTIEEIEVRYASYEKVGSSFMQTAAVYFTAVVPVRVENQ